MTLTEQIKQAAMRLGFQAVGISRLTEEVEPRESRLREWLRRGHHGEMAWMERAPDRRADPRKVLPGCRSVISVGMHYDTGHRADERPGNGRIARYAWGEDYHDVLLERLKALAGRITDLASGAVCRCYVDTGPVMEKAWAQQAGLGWIGKHSNLVSFEYGSWLLLGEILTTLDLEPDQPAADLCGTCSLCIQACPTGAIREPYVVDARRCISYLTIELRGPDRAVSEELANKMGNRIFGCDDCLDVCPYNGRATPTAEPAFQPKPHSLTASLEELHQLDSERFSALFRHSAVRRPKYAGFLRNVRIALRNWRRTD